MGFIELVLAVAIPPAKLVWRVASKPAILLWKLKQDRDRKRARVIGLAYRPACQYLDEMVKIFPNHSDPQTRLRSLYQQHYQLFDHKHRAHVYAVTNNLSNEQDIMAVRRLICAALMQKERQRV